MKVPEHAAEAPDPLSALAQEAVAGDDQAMRRLLVEVAPVLLHAVRMVLGGSGPEVEDATQEALYAVVHALPAFRGGSRFSTYATRIALRAATLARRRSNFRQRKMHDFTRAEAVAAQRAVEPVDAAMAAEREGLMRELFDELPDVQAETLALRVMLGYSIEEVAAATDAPANTVRSRVRAAREALRQKIEADPRMLEMLGRTA